MVNTAKTTTSRKEGDEGKRHRRNGGKIIAFVMSIMLIFLSPQPKAEAYEYQLQTSQKEIQDIIDNIGPEMNISGTTGISKLDFMYAMVKCPYDKTGKLARLSSCIYNACQDYDINEFAFCGFFAAESEWGKYDNGGKHNYFGMTGKGGYKRYETDEECIYDCARIIAEKYISEDGEYHTGGSLMEIGKIYSDGNEEYWSGLVANCAEMCTRSLNS